MISSHLVIKLGIVIGYSIGERFTKEHFSLKSHERFESGAFVSKEGSRFIRGESDIDTNGRAGGKPSRV